MAARCGTRCRCGWGGVTASRSLGGNGGGRRSRRARRGCWAVVYEAVVQAVRHRRRGRVWQRMTGTTAQSAVVVLWRLQDDTSSTTTTALREARRAAMIEVPSTMRLRLRNVAGESAFLLHASAPNRPAVAKLHMHQARILLPHTARKVLAHALLLPRILGMHFQQSLQRAGNLISHSSSRHLRVPKCQVIAAPR